MQPELAISINHNYNNYMDITFDPAKDAINLAKHGLSLVGAAKLDWESALVWLDGRKDYGEPRQCGLGLIGERVYYVAFVDRGDSRRMVSLRKANLREVEYYVEQT